MSQVFLGFRNDLFEFFDYSVKIFKLSVDFSSQQNANPFQHCHNLKVIYRHDLSTKGCYKKLFTRQPTYTKKKTNWINF